MTLNTSVLNQNDIIMCETDVWCASQVRRPRRKRRGMNRSMLDPMQLQPLNVQVETFASNAQEAVGEKRFREGSVLYTRAIELLATALDEDGPSSPRTEPLRGLHNEDEGDAVTLLAQLLYRRARVWTKMRDFRASIRDLDAAITIRSSPKLYLLKGVALMQIHQFAEASQTLLEGIKFAPNDEVPAPLPSSVPKLSDTVECRLSAFLQTMKREFDKCLCLLREQWQAYRRVEPADSSANGGAVHGPARDYDPGASPNVLAKQHMARGKDKARVPYDEEKAKDILKKVSSNVGAVFYAPAHAHWEHAVESVKRKTYANELRKLRAGKYFTSG